MSEPPRRVVTDSLIGLAMPDVAAWSDRVGVVLGQNPGVFTGPGTNTYLLGTGKRPILLDTGQGVPAYLPILERGMRELRNAEELQEIVLTHAHPDHIGGVEQVRQRYGALTVRKKPWPGRDATADPIAIDHDSVVETEGVTLRAIATPGHAADHLCFYLEEERAVFTGDVVLGAGTTVIPEDGDLAEYIASLQRLLELDIHTIYPAHGPMIREARAKIESYLSHRALREAQILEGLRASVHRTSDLVRRIYSDIPEFLHLAAGVSVEAHLRKLVKEGIVVRSEDEWHLST